MTTRTHAIELAGLTSPTATRRCSSPCPSPGSCSDCSRSGAARAGRSSSGRRRQAEPKTSWTWLLEHPGLYAIAFHSADARAWPPFRQAAGESFAILRERFAALDAAGLLGGRTVVEAAMQFNALCEGLAWNELRGNRLTPEPDAFWRSAVGALVRGLAG